jgi:cephalosporin-C deacetylase-like acetyl esterase
MTGYRIEKVAYESRPNHHVPALLYVPDAAGPHPGILLLMGHYQHGKTAPDHQALGGWLARLGFVVLCPDPFGQGERLQFLDANGQRASPRATSEHTWCDMNAMLVGRDAAGYEAWDNMRAIDYLYSRPEVDKTRKIGLTGTSGGGTMTTFLMALDDRIGPAAPSCFISSHFWYVRSRRDVNDGCQQLPGLMAAGIDHADYMLMHAPDPTLVLLGTRDQDFAANAWPTVREAARLTEALECGSRVLDVVESDTPHGMYQPHREAAASWMLRWLEGEDRQVTQDDDVETFEDRELWVTGTGQALTSWEGELSVPELTLRRARELESRRREIWEGDREAALDSVRRLIGLPDRLPPTRMRLTGRMETGGHVLLSGLVEVRGHPLIPVFVLVPGTAGSDPVPATLWLDGGGRRAALAHPEVRRRVGAGEVVWIPDLRGFGETADADVGTNAKFGIPGHRLSMIGALIGRPLPGLRVLDAMAALDVLASSESEDGLPRVDPERISLAGVNNAVPEALHLAALEGRVRDVSLEGGMRSWMEALEAPADTSKMQWIVPGALEYYDLTDLVRVIAPRPVQELPKAH